MRRQTPIALVALVVVIVSVVGATGALADHDNGVRANYTVVLPNEQDHYPGDQNQASASIWHLSAAGNSFDKTSSPEGLRTIEFIVIRSQAIDFSACGTSNTAAFGIDRGNDDPGTQTDEDLLAHREDSSFNKHSIVVDFFDEDAAFGSSTYFNASDQIVAVQNDCYTMPSEPGWYQIKARINGTGYNGNHIDEPGIRSHYFYICECASEEEAREKLGPPPSEKEDDSTPKPTATATPKSTATPESDATVTATPKSTATPGQQSTATATPGDKQNPGTASATPKSGPNTNATQSSGGNGGGGNGGGGNGSNGNGGGNGGTSGDGPLTPTVGAGPGFGALVAVLGVVAAALLATRE